MRANSNSKRPATKRGKSQAGKLTIKEIAKATGLDPGIIASTCLVVDYSAVTESLKKTRKATKKECEPSREVRFETTCRRKGLDPVAVCEGQGPGVAINRTGRRVYVQVDARFVRVPLYASVWWFERIFRSSGWTTFDDGALRWLRLICKRLETV